MSARGCATFLGDLSPQEAYALLSNEPDVSLLDVRTQAELSFVGGPDLSALGKSVGHLEWRSFPDGVVNTNFVEEFATYADRIQARAIIFLCRSGARSALAAQAVAEGLVGETPLRLFNLGGGFEGDLDQEGRRGRLSGWKAVGLPWRQS